MIRLTLVCSLLVSLSTSVLAETVDPSVTATPPEPAGRTMRIRLANSVETIPIMRVKGTIILPAMIAGKPVNMLFDNGTDASVIDTTLAQETGMPLTESRGGLHTGLSVMPTKMTQASVTVGRALKIEGRFVAADLGPMSRALGTPVGGILGADVLKPFVVYINPSRGWIVMGLPGRADLKSSLKVDSKPADAQATQALAQKLAPKIIPFAPGFIVKAEINGNPVNLQIDYGSNGTVTLRDTVWQQVIPPAKRTGKTSHSTRADGLTIGGEIGTGDLDIAGMVVSNVPIASRMGSDGVKGDGLLGLSVLGATTTVLNMPKHFLALFSPEAEVSVSPTKEPSKETTGSDVETSASES